MELNKEKMLGYLNDQWSVIVHQGSILVSGFCSVLNVVDARSASYYSTSIPYVLKLQQSLRKKTCKRLPPCTLRDWNNLAYLGIMTSMNIMTPRTGDDTLAEFWPTYLDIFTEVYEWMGYKGLADWIQEQKKIMLLTFGVPVSNKVRFDSFHLNPERYKYFKLVIHSTCVDKPHLRVDVLGNTGTGRSTTIGRLIDQCSGIDNFSLEKLEKDMETDSKDARVLSMFLNNGGLGFESDNYNVDIINRSEFINHAQTNSTDTLKADCAVFFVSACSDEFEAGASKIVPTLNLSSLRNGNHLKMQLIVVVNKMDLTEPSFSEARFEEIKSKLGDQIKEIGFNLNAVPFVPISGLNGDNIVEISSNTPWYTGWCVNRDPGQIQGKTLMEALDAMNACDARHTQTSL